MLALRSARKVSKRYQKGMFEKRRCQKGIEKILEKVSKILFFSKGIKKVSKRYQKGIKKVSKRYQKGIAVNKRYQKGIKKVSIFVVFSIPF